MKKLKTMYGDLSHKTKRVICESAVAVVLVIMIFISFLADISAISFPRWLLHKFSDEEGLLLTLFTVQASVSTLGIALVSIIAGFTSETIYGISTSRYITNIKPAFFTHNRLIILNLLIVIANYFAVSFLCFNVSVAFFSASVVITIFLAAELFIIFLGKDSITAEIQQYILENYSVSVLNDLNQELLKSIETGNSFITKQDCDILLAILTREVEKSNYGPTEITERMVNIVSDSFEKVSHLRNSLKSTNYLQFICDFYDAANAREESPLRISLWPQIDTAFFHVLEDLQYEQLRDEYPHLKLHSKIYKNLVGASTEEIKSSALSHYLGWIYYALFADSNFFSEKENTRLKESLFRYAYFHVVGNSRFSAELKEVALVDLCYLNKAAIDTGDIHTLTNQYLREFKYSHNDTRDISCLITVIYLYYLSCRENLVKGKALQKNAEELLKQNQSIISNFLSHNLSLSEIDPTHYVFIQSLLNRWEYMEEENVKYMIIDSVVADFFILTALFRYWDRKEVADIVGVVVSTSTFSFYNRYFPDTKFQSLRNMATEFARRFFPYMQDEMIIKKLYLLKDIFDEKYRTETIVEGTENAITPDQLEKLSTDTIAEINALLDRYPLLKSFGCCEEAGTIIERKNILLANIVIPNFVLQDNDYMRHLRSYLEYCVLATFFGAFKDYIDLQSLDYECTEKQETLIRLLKESGIDADLVAGSRDVFWEERDRNLLKRSTEKMNRVELPNNANCYYLIDSKLVSFILHGIKIKFEDLTWEEIKQDCRATDDGKFEFNVTNDLYVPFERADLQEHYYRTRKRLLIYGSIKYKQPSTPIGVGIEVKYQ